MASPQELKALALRRLEERGREAVDLALQVLRQPEVGFTEERTSRLVARALERAGVPCRRGIALTGVKGLLSGGAPGPTVAVMGELDSLRAPGHPYADPATGAAHACGHHAQLGMLVGAALALSHPRVLAHLSGRVAFIAVPAEEFIDLPQRHRLRREGRLGFLSGKQEFIRLGELDDVDMAMMCHTSVAGEHDLALGGTSNGHVGLLVGFQAGDGGNALNAAMLALSAVHANREALPEGEHPRFHGIVPTAGGPPAVTLEWRVRGRSIEAVQQALDIARRCFLAGALAAGARVRIASVAGYLPMLNNPDLQEVFRANAVALLGEGRVRVFPPGHNRGGSTDMGDVSHLIPAIHPYVSGAVGSGHGSDYLVRDYNLAVLTPARVMAMTVIDLLCDGARLARRILERHRPALTKERYLALQASRMREEVYEPR